MNGGDDEIVATSWTYVDTGFANVLIFHFEDHFFVSRVITIEFGDELNAIDWLR